MKNKIMLLALLVPSNFLVGMNFGAGAGLVGGAGEDHKSDAFAEFGIRLKDEDCLLSTSDVLFTCLQIHDASKAKLQLKSAQIEIKISGDLASANSRIKELESQGFALKKEARLNIVKGLVAGAAIAAGALVYVVNRKPEMLDKIKI